MSKEVVIVPDVRPPRRVTNKAAVDKAEAYVRRNLARYLKRLEGLAHGIVMAAPSRRASESYDVILRIKETGEERVVGSNLILYTTPPNLQALQYLSDRAMGKAPQRYEITGEEGGAIEIIPWLPAPNYIEGEIIGTEDASGTQEVLQDPSSNSLDRKAGSQEAEKTELFEVAVESKED